jgi:hypothetical protein
MKISNAQARLWAGKEAKLEAAILNAQSLPEPFKSKVLRKAQALLACIKENK